MVSIDRVGIGTRVVHREILPRMCIITRFKKKRKTTPWWEFAPAQ